jgi:TfoX/Sxy family transcriptional regulator of competence genes
MDWEKVSDEIVALHTDLVGPFICEKRKMFGCQVFFVNNNMFTGVYGDGIMMRLAPDDKKTILGEHEDIVPFTPMGREMKEYVYIPGKLLDNPAYLDEASEWMAKSYAFVISLPPKSKKTKSK